MGRELRRTIAPLPLPRSPSDFAIDRAITNHALASDTGKDGDPIVRHQRRAAEAPCRRLRTIGRNVARQTSLPERACERFNLPLAPSA